MLKKTIVYTDYNNEQQSEDLYFNLNRTELMNMLDLQPRLEAWAELTSGDPRELTTGEIKEFLSLITLLVEHAYGVRSEDGKRFQKSPELFDDFKQTAVYDEFIFGLFQDDGKQAVEFMTGIIPPNLREQMQTAELPELEHTEQEVPAWIRENREPTRRELDTMSQEQLREAFAAKSKR